MKEDNPLTGNKQLTIEEVHALLLEMLCYIDRVCRKNNIMYFLSGGTAIGAIREKGFIPWDDDVDIMLPRDEYERLIDVLIRENNKDYAIHSLRETDWDRMYACMFHNKTTGTHDLLKYVCMGVTIDILPIDGLPDTLEEARKYYSGLKRKYALLNACMRIGFKDNEKHKFAKKLVHRVVKHIGAHRICVDIDNKAKQRRYQDCDHVGCSVLRNYMEREYFDKQWFNHQEYVYFEDTKLPVMNGYDNYLNALYGDYMKRPEQAGDPRHQTTYYWK